MTTKKLFRRENFYAAFLSRLNFVIFYNLERKNEKTNLFTY